MWVGAHSAPEYAAAARQWAAHLQYFEGAPAAVEESEGCESEGFARALRPLTATPCRLPPLHVVERAMYDAELGDGRSPILTPPAPLLLVERGAAGEIIAPQQRWQKALHALVFVRHLSSY